MIRVAIVGVGNISRLHFEGYLSFPQRCRIVALADIFPERAKAAVDRLGLTDVKVYASHTEMLDDMAGQIDLVSVCTPPFCHAEITIDCLRAGCHVLCEKPMGASLEECDRMLAAERESGKMMSIIAQNRFRDPIMNLKKVLDSGKIGRVLHAQVDSFWWRGHGYYDLWWRGRWDKEGGGCTLNHAVHHIDMLLWMMGMPQKVTAVLSNANHDNAEVEDLSIAILQYDKGALAQITSSVNHHGEEQQLIFQGEKARVSAPWKVCASLPNPKAFPEPNRALEQELEDFVRGLPKLPYTSHVGQIENVLSAVEQGKRPFIDGASGRNTIELISAIFKAGSTERPVRLPLAPDDDFYTVDGILSHAPHFHKKVRSLKSLGGDITMGSDYKMKL